MPFPLLVESLDTQVAVRGPRPPKKKKARADAEHDNKAAERFRGVAGCSGRFLETVRWQAGNGHLPNAVWPAVSQFEQSGDGEQSCRYCNAELTTGHNGKDPFCKNSDCIFPWTFRKISAVSQTTQRTVTSDACARWALLPALILNSRYERIRSTGFGGKGFARRLAIETPAEAWAVWQLFVGHDNGWVDVRKMMAAHNVAPIVQNKVIRLLKESYANLVRGNEYLRALDLDSEVHQLVEGHNDNWHEFRTTMEGCGYDVTLAIALMENSYNMLTDEQLRSAGYDPTQYPRDPAAARAEIKAAHTRFETAMQQAEQTRRQAKQTMQQAKQTMQQAEASRQAIEALQCDETLSDKQINKGDCELRGTVRFCNVPVWW